MKCDKLRCPDVSCTNMATVEEVKQIIDGEIFDKFVKFNNDRKVNEDPNLLYCSRADCDQILDKRNFRKG